MLEDINGKEMPAIEIFSMTLFHLRTELLKQIHLSKTGMDDSDITCVLTVPAIWNDAAKQFMREAAIQVIYFDLNTLCKLLLRAYYCIRT